MKNTAIFFCSLVLASCASTSTSTRAEADDFDIDEALSMKKEIPEYQYDIAQRLAL